jgi:hypothetical protein
MYQWVQSLDLCGESSILGEAGEAVGGVMLDQ